MTAIKARVTGRVQGVGFRAGTIARAREAGLAGWVRNESDGSVTVWVQGAAVAVEGFCLWLHRGPPLARVETVRQEVVVPDPACRDFAARF